MSNTLIVRFSRLPDIDCDKAFTKTGLAAYGRCAVTVRGDFWLGDLRASHPVDTAHGWYWGITLDDVLIVSPRGAASEAELLLEDNKAILRKLITALVKRRIIPRVDAFHIDRGDNPEGNDRFGPSA